MCNLLVIIYLRYYNLFEVFEKLEVGRKGHFRFEFYTLRHNCIIYLLSTAQLHEVGKKRSLEEKGPKGG